MTTIHEQLWPQIRWREPIKITLVGSGLTRYGCRLCIAERGLKGSEVPDLWETEAEAARHVEAHGRDRPAGAAGL